MMRKMTLVLIVRLMISPRMRDRTLSSFISPQDALVEVQLLVHFTVISRPGLFEFF